VCQSRADVPKEMAALLWFRIGGSSTSVHFPVYGSVTRVSKGWAGPGPQDGVTAPLMTFSLNSAFYVFNLVANWAYSRWSVIYPDAYSRIIATEAAYFDKVGYHALHCRSVSVLCAYQLGWITEGLRVALSLYTLCRTFLSVC
jgi:dipeptidase